MDAIPPAEPDKPELDYRDPETAANMEQHRRLSLLLRYNTLEQDNKHLAPSGYETAEELEALQILTRLRQEGYPTLRPLLPLFFQLKGRPYSLRDYFAFEPLFRPLLSEEIVFQAARQVSKSMSSGAADILTSATIPYLSTLTVTPLYEMVRRFSHNYVGDLIKQSRIKNVLVDHTCTQGVLQRQFRNGSVMHFSYASLDAERCRGISCDRLNFEEAQNFDPDLLEIILQCLGNSEFSFIAWRGTPKTLDGPLAHAFDDSSQAQWALKCRYQGCGHWNIMAASHDLLDMIGPVREDISVKRPGLVCAKCRQPVHPAWGHWLHTFEDRIPQRAGYHVPRSMMPMHCTEKPRWTNLVAASQGKGGVSWTGFMNEVMGESWDVGSRLVTQADLRAAACLPWPNRSNEAVKHIDRYSTRVIAVDFGGGGGRVQSEVADKRGPNRRLRTSYTAIACLGLRPTGGVDVIWGHRSLKTHDHHYEADLVAQAWAKFKCTKLVYDLGAGNIRETLLLGHGIDQRAFFPVLYAAIKTPYVVSPPTEEVPRDYLKLNKPWSLGYTLNAIKVLLIRFFQYDHVNKEDPGLLHDFLSLYEEKIERDIGSDIYHINRTGSGSDDFAQAVNIGACALWMLHDAWPDIDAQRYMLSQNDAENRDSTIPWNEI